MSTIISTAVRAAFLVCAAGAMALGLAGPADAAASALTYGDPVAAAKWWRLQKYDDCAVMASAEVVGQMLGGEPSEAAIIRMAQSTPSTVHPGSIYITPNDPADPSSGRGTSQMDIPALLGRYGIGAKATDDNLAASNGVTTGMDALKEYLGSGHAVIVTVNSEMIWGDPIENKDDEGKPVADHAVVVTGVDTVKGIVHLNDSGTSWGRDEQVSLDLFARAWATGDHFLVVTGATIK